MSFGGVTFGEAPFGGFSGEDLSVISPVTQLLSGELEQTEDLLWVRPWDPAISARRDLYLGDGWASKPNATLPTGESLPNQYFLEVLDRAPNREVHVLESGAINASAIPSYGAAALSDPYKEFMPAWLSYAWEGAPVVHYVGSPDWDLSSFATTFRGEGSRFSPTGGVAAALQLRDILQKLQKAVEPATYLGFGACLKGDGVDDRLVFGDVYDRAGSFAVRCRVWPNSNTNALTRFWSKDDGSTAGGWAFTLNNQRPRFFVRGGAAAVETTANPVSNAAWTDLIMSLDTAAQAVTFYWKYDDSETVFSETLAYTSVPSATSVPLTFGSRSDGTLAFAGKWDELVMFSRALTLEEARTHLGKETLGDEPAVEEVWHCNEAAGGTAFATNTANHGTLTGGLAWAGSLTGTKSLAGKVRLGGAGFVLEREPALLDEVDLVYEVAHGGMVGVVQDAAGYMLKDRGIRPYVYDGNVSDPYSVTPAAGHWISCNALGLIRLGSKPTGRLTVTAQITTATDAGGIINFLAQKALTAGEIDAGALAGLTSDNPAPLTIPWGMESTTIDQHIVEAALSIGAWRTVDLEGRLAAAILEAPTTSSFHLFGDGSIDDDIEIDGIREVHTGAAARAVEIHFAPYETTQTATDLSSTLSAREKEDLSQAFRSYRTPDSAAAIAANAAAPLVIRETRLVHEKDARKEANREAALRATIRRTDAVALTKSRHDLQPGMVGTITAPILDYGPGKTVVVAGKIIDDASRQHTLEVWG